MPGQEAVTKTSPITESNEGNDSITMAVVLSHAGAGWLKCPDPVSPVTPGHSSDIQPFHSNNEYASNGVAALTFNRESLGHRTQPPR